MAVSRRALVHLPRQLSRRAFSISRSRASQSPFGSGPAPPRLPKEEQEVFERLQRQSTGAFSTPRSEQGTPSSSTRPNMRIQIKPSPDSTSSPSSAPSQQQQQQQQHPPAGRLQINQSPDSDPEIRFENGKEIRKGEDLHPNMRRGAPPEFEGDVNPRTGEVGGPKNEPLRWGVQGDWSYNGRVTDF